MKKRVIEVEVVGILEMKEDTVAVMVRRTSTKLPTGDEVRAVGNAIAAVAGDHVLVIMLGPNEYIETLSETEMNARGWIRGAVSEDRRTEIKRMH